MFKLYGYIPELKFIKRDSNEEKIIETLGKCIKQQERIQYMIVRNDGEGDIAYKIILNEKDYLDYIQEYVKNNKPLTRRLKKWIYTSYLRMEM